MTALAPSLFWRAAGPWTPATPGNLLAWWKADSGLTLSGSRVTTWADQSGNGHDLTEFSALGPTYDATGWNSSQPTVQFGGSNVFLRNITTSIASYPNGTGTPLTIFASCRAAAFVNPGALLHWFADPSVTDTYTFGAADSGGTGVLRVYDGTTDRLGSVASTGRRRLAYTYDGSNLKGYVDGSLDLSVGSLSIVKSGCNRMYMGAIWNLTQKWDGIITEMVVYSAALSSTHVTNYSTYSAAKWGG